jgi:hypothetical protein
MSEADFDALAASAADARNKMGEDAFVRAALELGHWYFIGVSPPDAPDEPEPMVAAGADGHQVLVFTDEGRAEGYRDHLGKKGKKCCVLHMPVGDAVEYLNFLTDHGVGSAHFNDGKGSATVSIRRVVQLAGA